MGEFYLSVVQAIWTQRFQNYLKILQTLAEAHALAQEHMLKDYLEEQGFVAMVQTFTVVSAKQEPGA